MTTQHRDGKYAHIGGICRECEHDLYARVVGSEGKLYCSNSSCGYARRPHPSPKEPNCPERLQEGRR